MNNYVIAINQLDGNHIIVHIIESDAADLSPSRVLCVSLWLSHPSFRIELWSPIKTVLGKDLLQG